MELHYSPHRIEITAETPAKSAVEPLVRCSQVSKIEFAHRQTYVGGCAHGLEWVQWFELRVWARTPEELKAIKAKLES